MSADVHHRWLTGERLRLYPTALLCALLVAFVLALVTADGSGTATGRLGGDFPAFFGAGRLVAEGRVEDLYDWRAQRASQAGLHPPGEEDRFLAFAYPPFVALPYAALVPLGYVAAYAVHSAFMAAVLGLAVWALGPVLPRVGRWPVAAYALCLALLPLFRAVTGGQNTALTLALLVAVWRLLHDRRDALAGVPLGLLLFKPQLGLPLAGLVAVRHPRALPALLGVGAGLYALGASLGGWGWPAWWWSQIGRFHALDQDVNAPNSVGVLGVAEAILGPGSTAALVVAVPLVVGLVGWLLVRWARSADPLDVRMAVTAPALALMPPHAMHYDSGLIAVGWLVIADRLGRGGVSVLGALLAASWLGEARALLGWNPMAGVAAATLVVAAWLPPPRAVS